jgi:hypothetical protein
MRTTIFLLLLITATAGCLRKPTDDGTSHGTPRADTVGIFGKWEWVMSSGGIAGMTIYPASGEYSYYQFTLDSTMNVEARQYGTYDKWSSKFSLSTERSFVTGAQALFLHIADSMHNSMPQSVWLHGNDTLELLDEVADGFGHLYVRRR